MSNQRPADVRGWMSANQRARAQKFFPASRVFSEAQYTIGREGNTWYCYCAHDGFWFADTTPQTVFNALRNEMNNRGITGALIHIGTGTITNVQITLDRNNTILEGEGWQTFLDGAAGVAVTIDNADGCVLRDFGCRSTGTDAIEVINTGNTTIRNVWVWGAAQHGINFDAYGGLIDNCLIHDVTNHGILVDGSADAVNIENCFITVAGQDGIVISGFNTNVSDTSVYYAARDGIRVEVSDAKLHHNEVYYISGYGIHATGAADYLQVIGNDICSTGNDGIYVAEGAEHGVVANNLLYEWTNEPIDNDEVSTKVEHNNAGGDVQNSKGVGFSTIQAAINHLAGDGGWVDVPENEWTESVLINSGAITLRGHGNNTVINWNTSGGNQGVAITVAAPFCEVRDLQVWTTLSGTDCIMISGADYCKIYNVEVEESVRDGIAVHSDVQNIVEQCRIAYVGRHGIFFDSDAGRILKSYVTLCSGWGIVLSGCRDTITEDNEVSRCVSGGILSDARRGIISKNSIHDISGFGIRLISGADDSIVSNNILYSGGRVGIGILLSSGITNSIVEGNRVMAFSSGIVDNGVGNLLNTNLVA